MIPHSKTAENELSIAGELNPGPWVQHSENVGKAAKAIAEKCKNLDPEKAYVLGLLHDIGRRAGIFSMKHIWDGYSYAHSKNWSEVERICITHSYPLKDVKTDIGKNDLSKEAYSFIDNYLKTVTYDDYDKLIILCDALGDCNGFCILEKRFVDTTRRYGFFPFTVDRWNAVFHIKEYFEGLIGCSIYDVLPGVKENTFIDVNPWSPPHNNR